MKKIYSLLMTAACLMMCSQQSWAQEGDYDVDFTLENATLDNYFKDWNNGVTISTSQTQIKSTTSNGTTYYYVELGNTPNDASDYFVEVNATSEIESVEFLLTGNSSNKKLNSPILGWESKVDKSTADLAMLHAEVTSANKGLANAQWLAYDLSEANVKIVRLYRTVKNVTVDGVKETRGNSNTIYVYGVRVKLKATKEVKFEVTTLTGVTVNGTALEAGKLADLLANGTLDIAYKSTEAPEVVFNTLNTITYDDNTTKETAGVAEVTISGADGNYVATATVGENEYTINFNYVKTYTVSYGNAETNWENVYAYVWNGGDNNTWPGQLMTNTEEDYIWTIDLQGLSFEPANVIFSNGKNSDNGGQQTATLGFENGKTYGALPRVITFDNTKAGWENVNAYVWDDNENKNAEWPGVAMTANGNIYTYTLCSSWEPTGVVFNNGNGGDQNQTVDLAYNAENAHYANASKMDETYVVKLPGVPAWEGDLVPSARPVKGIAKFTLNGAVSGEFKVLVNETWHGNGQALTIGEWINVAENGEPNLTYPAECADALCTFVEYNCITNEIRINVLNLVPVEGTTTWVFTSANSADVAGANGDGLEAFSAHEGWAEGFNAAALAAKAQYLYYKSNKCFQGTRLVFNSTVDGTLVIEFSNTGSKNGTRHIAINGTQTTYGASGTSHVTTDPISVLAGMVEISGIQGELGSNGGTVGAPNQLRIFNVTFTAVEEYIHVHFDNSVKQWEAPHVKYSTDGGVYVTKAMTKSSAHLVRPLADEGVEDETPKADIWTVNIPANATHLTFSDGADATYDAIFTGEDIAKGVCYGPSGNTTGVESIEAENVEAAPVYYNMQGVRVAEPTNGIYIVVRGSKVSKEIIR